MKDSPNEFREAEKQMANISNTVLETNQTPEDFIDSEAESVMIAMTRELDKNGPKIAVHLKEPEESEKQISELTAILINKN